MNLLIVDDEILAIQGLVDDMEWKKLDFDEVFTANSYAQAVNIMNKQEIDVLLCDIEMPLRSGVELVRWAKERNPELECIFLTCHAEFSFCKTGHSDGLSGLYPEAGRNGRSGRMPEKGCEKDSENQRAGKCKT